jgi:hypothetical protein
LAERFYTSFIAFSALAKELSVVIIPFFEKEWLVFITIVPTL